MLEQLRNWVSGKSDYEDVLAILPAKARGDRRMNKPVDGFVYLICSGAYYKIGRSDELERRVKEREIRITLPDSARLGHSHRRSQPELKATGIGDSVTSEPTGNGSNLTVPT